MEEKILTALVQRFKKDQSSSNAEQLISNVEQKVFRYCFYMSKNEEMAKDLCQDVLVKSLEKIHQLKDDDKYLSWCFQIAKNLLINYKKRKDNQAVSLDSQNGEIKDASSEEKELFHIRDTLNQMLEIDAQLLLLVDLEQYTYQEAAKTLGIKESAIKSRVSRARDQFKALFNKS